MKVTAQTMVENTIQLSIESSCDDKWDVTVYQDSVDEEGTRKHERVLSGYFTVEELKALEDMFYKARYLAHENTEVKNDQ